MTALDDPRRALEPGEAGSDAGPLPAPVKVAVTAVLLLPAAVALGLAMWKLRRRLREQAARPGKKGPRPG